MSIIDTPTIADDAQNSFPSLAALQAAHLTLLKLRREAKATDVLISDIIVFLQRGRVIGRLLDTDGDRQAAQSLLDYWANALHRLQIDPPYVALVDFDPLLAPELPDEPAPYQGLDAFLEANSHQFFGRGRVLDEILARLRQQRLIAVVGPSGSGKSSLVLAGLLPLLRMNALPGSAAWRYLPPIVPGSDPLASLQRVFEAAGITIAGSESDDRRVGSESSTSNPSPPIVLVVDQFEELFTLCDDPAARAAFVKQLQALVIAPEARHVVILTMRSDFETFVARLPEFQSHFDAGRVQVTPLSATELREAIEKPAEQVGLKFEPGVVDLLLQDLLGEPAGLPLLQFTLLKLWERRRRNQVTRAIYDEVGGGRLALARSADTFYASLIPQDQATARRILLRLVRPGEGMEFTSSRVRRETLYRGGDDPDRIDRVLAKLIQARLVRQTGSGSAEDIQIEIAHEALARNWPTLVEWLEQRKAAIVARRRLDQRAADWVRLGQGAAGLFDETELYEAEQWLQGPDAADLGFDPLLPTLVQTSKGAIAQDRERRIAQQVELETVQRIAETEQRRATEQAEAARRLRQRSLLLIVALTVALIALAATIVAVVAAVQSGNAQAIAAAQAQESAAQARHSAAQARTAEVLAGTAADNARAAQATAVAANQRADAQLRSSRSRVIAAEAIAQLDVDHERSILLALEAVTREHNVQTEDALRRSLLAVPLLATLGQQGHPTMQRAAYSPDGKYIVTASWDGVASVWEVKSHNLLFPIQTNQSRLHAAAYSPDGSKIAIAGQDGTIKLWDVKTRQFLMTLTGHAGDVNSVAYSRDGRRLVSAGADTTAIIWDVQTGQPIATLKGHTGAVNRAAFSPDGGRIVTASDDKTARLWDAQSGKSLATLVGHTEPVNSAVFSPSGDRIVTASNDNLARVWNAQTGRPLPIILVGHTSWVLDAAFSPDGRLIATASSDNTVKIWYASLGQEYLSLHSHSNSVQSVVFSSDGANVLTASSDGTAKLWVARPGQEEATLLGHINSVLSAAYSPDGKHIVTASFDQTARIWDTQTGHELVVLRGHTGWVYSAVYSPDGRTILTAGTDGTARIWDAATGQPIKMLTGHAETVRGAAFSPDGRSIVTASTDRTVRIWDVQSGQERLRLEHPSGVVAVVYSPDGRQVVTACGDTVARIWDAGNGTLIHELRGHTAEVTSVAYSPDGKYVVTASSDNTAILWDAQSGAAVRTFAGHGVRLWGVAYSPDGKYIVTASDDLTARIWDVGTARQLVVLHGARSGLTSVAYSPDGSRIITTSWDSWGRQYLVRIDDLLKLAKPRVNRVLSPAERKQFELDQ